MSLLPYVKCFPKSPAVPLLVSSPHSGVAFPEEIAKEIDPKLVAHPEDTDWFIEDLYSFIPELGGMLIHARYSRYVIDLNREPEGKRLYDDQRYQSELVPRKTFSLKPIYLQTPPAEEAIESRKTQYYWPYYQEIGRELQSLKENFGAVLFFDAHSIKSFVPSIRPKKFPHLILGDRSGSTAHNSLSQAALASLRTNKTLHVNYNDPFQGGHLTQYFGNPQQGVHALQLEMCQDLYMDESSDSKVPAKRQVTQEMLKEMFLSLLEKLDGLR